jgi:predicted O-linked N-acetylglucosamine transferase (SPINDLY family)
MTARFQAHSDRWWTTTGITDAALAERIRADGVDILVDLAQHLAGNRLTMFARQPAPVQASFAGYPDGTGLKTIAYRITDRHLEPSPASDGSERLWFIDSFWCYAASGLEVEVNELPAITDRTVTFGCLNNFCKVNEGTWALWARVISRVPGSRLIVLSPYGIHRADVLTQMRTRGIDAERIEFVAPRPRRDYFDLYHRLDVALDTFPYNGHTTNLDALWMGVPVVSLTGETPVSRAGLSILTNLGLTAWAARTEDEYVGKAVALAEDLLALAQWRAHLRERIKVSMLMDASHFTRQIEQAYREMWRAWCEQERARRA